MAAKGLPLYERVMEDGAGLLKKEFIEHLRGAANNSEEIRAVVTKHIREVTTVFLQVFEEKKLNDLLLKSDMYELIAEITRLRILLKPEPKNDGELYDQHVNMLRLLALCKQAFSMMYSEQELERLIKQDQIDKTKFIYWDSLGIPQAVFSSIFFDFKEG